MGPPAEGLMSESWRMSSLKELGGDDLSQFFPCKSSPSNASCRDQLLKNINEMDATAMAVLLENGLLPGRGVAS